MSPSSKHPLSEHLSPRVPEARLARQWGVVYAHLGKPSRVSRPWVFAVSIAALVAAVAFVAGFALRRPHIAAPVAVTEAREVVTLPDGSRVTLDPASHIAVTRVTAETVHVVLEAGAIDLDIPRAEARTFVVRAAQHEITVLGTAFRVQVDPDTDNEILRVSVTRGRVQVARTDGSLQRVLGAGETWSTTVAPTAPVPDAPLAPPPSAKPVEPSPVAPPPPLESGRMSAKALLAHATEARAKGRSAEAASLFDQLRKQHRSDARAGLAAFELGRLRLDELRDAKGALEAFDDAIALSPAAPFREDADARRVDALDALGNAGCAAARAAYLERYPQGVHVRAIRSRCPTR